MLTLGELLVNRARIGLVRAELRRIEEATYGHDEELDGRIHMASLALVYAADQLDWLIAGDGEEIPA